MRLLADENMHPRVIQALRAAGHDVVAVSEVARSAPDDDVLALADSEQRVLLTFDKDFGELVFLWGLNSAGVILLRMPGAALSERITRLLRVLPDIENQALARFVAESSGRPFIRLAVIKHPLGGLSQEQVYRKAEEALDTIVRKAAG